MCVKRETRDEEKRNRELVGGTRLYSMHSGKSCMPVRFWLGLAVGWWGAAWPLMKNWRVGISLAAHGLSCVSNPGLPGRLAAVSALLFNLRHTAAGLTHSARSIHAVPGPVTDASCRNLITQVDSTMSVVAEVQR